MNKKFSVLHVTVPLHFYRGTSLLLNVMVEGDAGCSVTDQSASVSVNITQPSAAGGEPVYAVHLNVEDLFFVVSSLEDNNFEYASTTTTEPVSMRVERSVTIDRVLHTFPDGQRHLLYKIKEESNLNGPSPPICNRLTVFGNKDRVALVRVLTEIWKLVYVHERVQEMRVDEGLKSVARIYAACFEEYATVPLAIESALQEDGYFTGASRPGLPMDEMLPKWKDELPANRQALLQMGEDTGITFLVKNNWTFLG